MAWIDVSSIGLRLPGMADQNQGVPLALPSVRPRLAMAWESVLCDVARP